MLKKEQVLKGAILEVLPVIKDGLPGFGLDIGGEHSKEHLLLTAEPGGALMGRSWGVTSGSRLEVVDKPKRRQGINTAIVKVIGSDVEGHVYWCELRASAKLITPAPEAE